jgi:hypothetical protein
MVVVGASRLKVTAWQKGHELREISTSTLSCFSSRPNMAFMPFYSPSRSAPPKGPLSEFRESLPSEVSITIPSIEVPYNCLTFKCDSKRFTFKDARGDVPNENIYDLLLMLHPHSDLHSDQILTWPPSKTFEW